MIDFNDDYDEDAYFEKDFEKYYNKYKKKKVDLNLSRKCIAALMGKGYAYENQ